MAKKKKTLSDRSANSIPIDLIIEILAKLPAKSVVRFYCVSKLWKSILSRPYFTDLFLKVSSVKPRLLFAIPEDGVWSFFSLPQHQNPYEKSSSSSFTVVSPEFHVKFPPDNMRIYPHWKPAYRRYFACGYASGLILFYKLQIKKDSVHVICNPNTGRYVTLPYLLRNTKSYTFIGFDPIDKQYKVLSMAWPIGSGRHYRILTLGTGEMSWRKVKCSIWHENVSEGICINGVLYYLGFTTYFGNSPDDATEEYVIVCFDVRSEKFSFIYIESFCKLINYKGKLAVIYWKDYHDEDDWHYWENDDYVKWEDYVKDSSIDELRVWVLEDVKKQEWSKYVYTLRDEDRFSRCYVSVVGGIATTGDIVFTMCDYTTKQPFYVFYFNPERNTLQRFEIQGFGEKYHEAIKNQRVYTFVDHIEDLNVVNDPKLHKSCVYVPHVITDEEREKHFSDSESESEEEEEEGDNHWS